MKSLELAPAFIKGDSYGAVAGSTVDGGTKLADLVCSRLRTLTPANTSVGGTRCDQILMAQVVNAGWTWPGRGLVLLPDVILNDVYTANTVGATPPAETAEAFRSLLAHLTALYRGTTGDSAVQFGAGWTGGVSSTANAYVDVSWTGDEVWIVLGFGTTTGSATITDSSGNVVATVTLGGYLANFNGVQRLTGFGAGTHSVRVKVASGSVTFAGYLVPAGTAAPTIAWWEPGDIADSARSTRKNATLAALEPVAALFPTVIRSGVDGSWDKTTMLGVDGVHMNDKGNEYAASRVMASLAAVTFRAGQNRMDAGATYTPLAAPTYSGPGAAAPNAPAAPTATAAHQLSVAWVIPTDGGATITGYDVAVSSDVARRGTRSPPTCPRSRRPT